MNYTTRFQTETCDVNGILIHLLRCDEGVFFDGVQHIQEFDLGG